MSGLECLVSLLTGYEDVFNKWCISGGLNGNS